MTNSVAYSRKLTDPRWQRKRLEILSRDNFTCVQCGCTEKTLHVHHTIYRKSFQPWDAYDDELQTLCEDCHASITDSKKILHANIDLFFTDKKMIEALGRLVFNLSEFSPQYIEMLIRDTEEVFTERADIEETLKTLSIPNGKEIH